MNRRDELARSYGDAFEACEKSHSRLKSFSAELERLHERRFGSNHTVSKYGYAAHLRTYAESHDSKVKLFSIAPHAGPEQPRYETDAAIRDDQSSPKFYKQPLIRQYFHKGLLWRGPGVEEVGSFELFFDLLYVGILAIIGERASSVPTGVHFHRFIIFMFLTWKIWNDLIMLISWFETGMTSLLRISSLIAKIV